MDLFKICFKYLFNFIFFKIFFLQVLGSKQNVYRLAEEEGWFLPKYTSRAVTVEYLMDVLSGRVFRCLKSDVKNPPYEKRIWSNIDIIAWLEIKVAPTRLGISYARLPDRNWLISLAFSYDQQLEIFTGAQPNDQIVSIPLKLLEQVKFFDPYMRSSKRPVLKKSDDQKKIEESEILKKRRFRKERRADFLANQTRKLHQEISELDAEMDLNMEI